MPYMKGKSNRLRPLAVLVFSAGLLSNVLALAQGPPQRPPQRPAVNQSDDPILKRFRFRAIGPASMGGRVDDIVAVESNPYIIYVGLATGGVWKTINNGTTWEPVFEAYSSSSIGDIDICQSDPNIVWVGTGEPNNRQSATIGDGIYKSTDAGKTFTNMGLKDTQSIARVVTDPRNPNIVYVAALGHLFGPNRERGIFKTTDGGKSWTKIAGSGLPEEMFGRIGLDVSRSNPNVIYAQIEVGMSA